jgi:hypothetical protein
MNNNDTKHALILFLFMNFGKHFAFDKLAENVADLDRLTAYEVLEELEGTKHVVRTQKERSNGNRFYTWGVDPSDEFHALEVWSKYLRDAR